MELFAAHGAYVQILDLDQSGAKAVVDGVVANGGNAIFYCCDVSDRGSVCETFEQIAQDGLISIVINNAGISHIGNVEQTSEAEMERVFSVNVKGVYNCIQAAVRHMKSSGGGVILNMASVVASVGVSDRFAYSMSKGAVIAMTYSVARDYLAYNIRCNCISPARIHTPFIDNYVKEHYSTRETEMFQKLASSQPIGRMGKPEEVAALALFLCSDEASFVTGTNYPIDGGFIRLNN